MILLVIGCAVIALGVLDYRRGAISSDAVAVDGVVSDISTISSATRPGKKMHAPIVEFRNPTSGRMATVQTQSHTSNKAVVGEHVTVMYDAATDSATIPDGLLRRIGVGLLGLTIAALGVLSLAGVF